jgi:RimJ/RimL family protein N-acetyltransferase
MSGFVLRPVRQEDAGPLLALTGDPLVYRWMFDGAAPGRAVVDAWIAARQSDAALTGWGGRVLIAPGGRIAGWVGLEPGEPGTAELGYALHPAFWGRGLATRMGWTAMLAGFSAGGLREIRAGTDAPNVASRRVMERLGMRFLRRVDYPLGPGAEYVRAAGDPPPDPVPEPLPAPAPAG